MAEKNNKHEKNIPILSHEIIMLAKKLYEKFDGDKGVIQTIDEFLDFITVDQNGDIHFNFPDTWVGSYDNDTAYGLDNSVNPTPTSENTDYVRIFGDLSVDDLNRAIKQYKAEFDSYPYLIMNESTLKAFEDQCQGLTCSDMSLICDKIDDCDDCPVSDFDGEDMVIINYDCEKGTFNAYYTHDDNNHTIVIDNNLAFGVVKVR